MIHILILLKSSYFRQFSTEDLIKPVGSDKIVILGIIDALVMGQVSWVSWRPKNEMVKSKLAISMYYFVAFLFSLTTSHNWKEGEGTCQKL